VEFQEVLRRRHMVRAFSDEALDPRTTERVIANALRAPSAGFTQGWAFLVFEGPEQTATFWDASFATASDRQTFTYPGLLLAPLVIVILADKDAYLTRYAEVDKGRAPESAWPVPWWFVDSAYAALLMLLTAVDADLGALFFGLPRSEAVMEAFGVPANLLPLGAVAVGHPAPDRQSPSLARGWRPMDDVVHRAHW